MPLNGRLTWAEKLDEIQRRLSENTPADAAHTPGFDIPYFSRSEIELFLLEVSNAKLGILSIEEIGNANAVAVSNLTGASPLALPAGAVEIISSPIDSAPAVETEPARYYWALNESIMKYFTVMKNTVSGLRSILHTGLSGSFSVLKEVPLASWQANTAVLPPGYDEECIREVCLLCQLQDFLPEGSI